MAANVEDSRHGGDNTKAYISDGFETASESELNDDEEAKQEDEWNNEKSNNSKGDDLKAAVEASLVDKGKPQPHEQNLEPNEGKNDENGFNVEEKKEINEAIYKQLNAQYRTRRYKLHQHFKQFATKEEAMQNKPEGVTKCEDGIWLCNYFFSEEFQKISKRNTKNHAKLPVPHTIGTRFIACLQDEKQKEGKDLDDIEIYELTRLSTKKKAFEK